MDLQTRALHSKARRVVTKASALATTAAFGAAFSTQNVQAVQDMKALRIPGEFEPIKAIWLSYDEGHKALTLALIKALSPNVMIKVLTNDLVKTAAIQTLLITESVRLDNIQFFTDPKSLFFMRDVAVFASAFKSGKQDGLSLINFRWQYYGLPGWCRRRYAEKVERVSQCVGAATGTTNEFGLALANQSGVQSIPSNLIIEGGAIEVNGEGLIIANEKLLQQRNPGISRAALQREYLALPGIRKVIWLAEGLAEDPHLRGTIVGNYVGWGTGGHTDEFVRFADPQTVLLAWPNKVDAASHPVVQLNRIRMQRNFEILSQSTSIDGRRFRVLKVPMPKIIERQVRLSALADRAQSDGWTADFFPTTERRREGDQVIQVASASYLNFVVANGVVVVPSYVSQGTPQLTETTVKEIFAQAFPRRDIVFVDAMSANWVGGGPHCATLHEPR
jgi:agmatine deiminase